MFTVFFETFGCQMNVADSTMLAELLAERGYTPAPSPQTADLIIVNTCSVRERAEQRAKTRLNEFARIKKQHQQLWVVGCMAQRLGNTLKNEIRGIDRVIGAESLEYIANDIDTYLADKKDLILHQNEYTCGISAFLPITRGCNNFCAYCIVPFVRGREHSIPAKELRAKAVKMVSLGTKEITLLGQNVNSYRDETSCFSDLINALHDIAGLERIRFVTSHPKDLSDTLIKTIADLPKVCKHVHLPVQSGSTRILALMNRNYSREHYLERIAMIRAYMPDADITTDVMVGFPGESNNDYQETLSLVEQVGYTSAFMFAFSIRAGTKAATMDNQIPDEEKKIRLKKLIELQTEITKKKYAAMVNKTCDILITNRQQQRDRAWIGQNFGCKRVLISCQDDLSGMILPVTIVKSTGMTLLAERINV